MKMDTLTLMFYIVVAILIGAVAITIWYLTKEKRELPLPNETDLGKWMIPLPNGIEDGHLTTARRNIERNFELAITNCDNPNRLVELQELRNDILSYNLFAFKGDKKYYLYSNEDITNEKFSIPIHKDIRFLKITDCIYIGEHDGFHTVFLKMPSLEDAHMKPEEHKTHSSSGEVIKYIRSAAQNIEKVAEIQKDLKFTKDELAITQQDLAKERSEKEIAKRGLAQKPLSTGEEPRPKGTLRGKIEEFLGGYRILASLGVGGLLYWIWPQGTWPHEPIFPAIIAGLIFFWVYPYIAKRI